MNMAFVIHIKTNFESWEKLFLSSYDNQKRVDEGKILYGKVDDKTAMVMNFDVDMEEIKRRRESDEFAKLIAKDVESHEVYTFQSPNNEKK